MATRSVTNFWCKILGHACKETEAAKSSSGLTLKFHGICLRCGKDLGWYRIVATLDKDTGIETRYDDNKGK